MNLTLRTVRQDELPEFKKEMQKAFQLGAEAEYGETDMQILPEADIEQALQVDDEEYADILRHVLAAKARTLRDTDSYVRRTKLLRHAASRGFEAEVIFDLLPD